MVIKESLESTNEVAQEVQKTITAIKVPCYKSATHLEAGRFIKVYKEELELETELKWLSEYLGRQKKVCREEACAAKEAINKQCLQMKCRQIENMFQNIESDENEDFGEE